MAVEGQRAVASRTSSGAGHLRHHDVGDDELDPAGLALQYLERLAAAGAGDRPVAQLLQRADGRPADPRIVLDDEDRGARGAGRRLVRAGWASDGGRSTAWVERGR